jgi:NADH-quinone oxidoreductase subunit F
MAEASHPNLARSGVFPLMPSLHRIQERDGCLTRTAVEELAAALKRPVADLYSAASFYHYFTLEGQPPVSRGRCRGPVCSLPGIAPDDELNSHAIACPGLCDQAPAKFAGRQFFSSPDSGGGFRVPAAAKDEEALFSRIRAAHRRRLENYRRAGGYRQLLKIIESRGADEALEVLQKSGLTGRGGAAFSLASKWHAVRESPQTPKYVVCNADEGEPGTFKDRPLLHLDPHLLLEAMAIAGYIVGAETGILYLRYEYPEAYEVLAEAIREAEDARLLGDDVAATGITFRMHLRRGAGSYVCGEETALLNSLEGNRPWPRERPPFPTTRGLDGKPTVVNNVETLCFVPLILERGADWFRSLGRGENAGTKIYSVSGKVERPGNYELPLGISARELIFDRAGGVPGGRTFKAFTLGGISGGLLGAEHLDLALDYQEPQRLGVFLGSGGVIVLDDGCCIVDFVRACMLFYESESCGKCYPCRIGTVRLCELLDGLTGRTALPRAVKDQTGEIARAMTAASACGLGQSAPLVMTGMFNLFSSEVDQHLRKHCPAGTCKL